MQDLKIYYFEDSLFCYVALVIARSKEEAIKHFKKRKISVPVGDIREVKIENGFFIDGGGNG